jgi:hypothetical protein
VRFLATLLSWVLATVALAVAVPAMWAQHTVVDRAGYASFAASAAKEPALQQAVASLLTGQIVALSAKNGYGDLNPDLVRTVTDGYTQNSGFPGQFAQANRIAHDWMFTDDARRDEGSSNRWLIDVAPMLKDSSLQATLGDLNLQVPDHLEVPITVSDSSGLRPGQLKVVAQWGPWVSVGAAVLAVSFALLTLAAARSRGRGLGALGVSALIVGAGGWAGIEVGRRYLDHALNRTAGDVRQIVDVMVGHAIASLHLWLNLTIAAGVVLVLVGVLASMLGGVRKRIVREPVR